MKSFWRDKHRFRVASFGLFFSWHVCRSFSEVSSSCCRKVCYWAVFPFRVCLLSPLTSFPSCFVPRDRAFVSNSAKDIALQPFSTDQPSWSCAYPLTFVYLFHAFGAIFAILRSYQGLWGRNFEGLSGRKCLFLECFLVASAERRCTRGVRALVANNFLIHSKEHSKSFFVYCWQLT